MAHRMDVNEHQKLHSGFCITEDNQPVNLRCNKQLIGAQLLIFYCHTSWNKIISKCLESFLIILSC